MTIGVSPTGEWIIIRAALERRIGELRDTLERADDPTIRGEIRGLRWLQAEVEPTVPLTEPTNYFPGQSNT